LEQGGDLCQALPQELGKLLAPQPVALQQQVIPQVEPITSQEDDKIMGRVSVSAGFIDLANRLSHAKAVNRFRPGFFDQYVQSLAQAAGDDLAFHPVDIVDARFWTVKVLNEQASYFNQMVGMMLAINLSHHYLGHFNKYSAQLAAPGQKIISINDLLTPQEWEESVKAGARDALHCALSTDGARVLFEAIDKMQQRPAWSLAIVPKDADLKKLNKDLVFYEKQFYRGKLDFSLCDKIQLRRARDQSPFMSLPQEALDGGPSLLAVIQRPMIDIHADELIRQIPPHVPRVTQGMGHSLSPVIETELDAVRQNTGND
jgi:hypothetical protein